MTYAQDIENIWYVISAQKMLFLILFITNFEHSLCTNQRN